MLKSDGHVSRYAPAALDALEAHYIDLYILPSHTSQCTQPLDLVTFGVFKTSLSKNLKNLSLKNLPEGVSAAAAHRCKAIAASLEALHVATSKAKTKSAFARGGIILTEKKVILDPSKFALHLPNPDHVFDVPLLPPPRTALYSCILNTTEIIELVKVAKKVDQCPQIAKQAWLDLAAIRDGLTEAETDFFLQNPDVLPWVNNPVIGKDPNLAFEVSAGPRKSIAPHSELEWYERLLLEKKQEIAENKRMLYFTPCY